MIKKVFLTILLFLSAILFAYFFLSSIVLILQYHAWRSAVLQAFLGCIALLLYVAIWFKPNNA